jgi:hypothetical protein
VHPQYIGQRDRGYAFVAIAQHGADIQPSDPAKWLDEATKVAGLGGVSSIAAVAEIEMAKPPVVLDGPYGGQLEQLVKAGGRLFQLRGVAGDQLTVAQGSRDLNASAFGNGINGVRAAHRNVSRAMKDEGVERFEKRWDIDRKCQVFRLKKAYREEILNRAACDTDRSREALMPSSEDALGDQHRGQF